MHDYFIKRKYLGTPCTFSGIFGNPCTICDSRMRVTSHKRWFLSTENIFGIKTWARVVEVRWEVDRWVWRPLTCRCCHPELLRVLKHWKDSHVSGKNSSGLQLCCKLLRLYSWNCNVAELSCRALTYASALLIWSYFLNIVFSSSFRRCQLSAFSRYTSTKSPFSSQAILVKIC